MYGKIFDSIFDGTLYGHWEAIITLENLLVICTSEGIVDMSPAAISGRTSIPLEHIQKGLDHLSQPDPQSRSPDEEGRRIVLLDPQRPWGWRIVNHRAYRDLTSREDKLKADRERIAEKRRKNKDVADSRSESPKVADVAHADAYAYANTGKPKSTVRLKPDVAGDPSTPNGRAKIARGVIDYLNHVAGTRYQGQKSHLNLIVGRIQEGATVEQMKAVIDAKAREWGPDPERRKFLSPDTLFNATKWAKYVGQLDMGEVKVPGAAPKARTTVAVRILGKGDDKLPRQIVNVDVPRGDPSLLTAGAIAREAVFGKWARYTKGQFPNGQLKAIIVEWTDEDGVDQSKEFDPAKLGRSEGAAST